MPRWELDSPAGARDRTSLDSLFDGVGSTFGPLADKAPQEPADDEFVSGDAMLGILEEAEADTLHERRFSIDEDVDLAVAHRQAQEWRAEGGVEEKFSPGAYFASRSGHLGTIGGVGTPPGWQPEPDKENNGSATAATATTPSKPAPAPGIAFGVRHVSARPSMQCALTNRAPTPRRLQAELVGRDAAQFTVVLEGAEEVVGASACVSFSVVFCPSELGVFAARLRITVPSTGIVREVPVSGEARGLRTAPAFLSWPDADSAARQTLHVYNPNAVPVTVQLLLQEEDCFAVSPATLTIAPRAHESAEVRCTDFDDAPRWAHLLLSSEGMRLVMPLVRAGASPELVLLSPSGAPTGALSLDVCDGGSSSSFVAYNPGSRAIRVRARPCGPAAAVDALRPIEPFELAPQQQRRLEVVCAASQLVDGTVLQLESVDSALQLEAEEASSVLASALQSLAKRQLKRVAAQVSLRAARSSSPSSSSSSSSTSAVAAAAPQAELSFKPSIVDFGSVAVGETTERRLKLQNWGARDVRVRVTSPAEPFGVRHRSFVLRARKFVRLPVSFTASREGLFSAVVEVASVEDSGAGEPATAKANLTARAT